MKELTSIIVLLLEKASRPGVMSLNGEVMEKKAAKKIRPYFKKLGAQARLRLIPLANTPQKEVARHSAEIGMKGLVRRESVHLLRILSTLYMEAMLKADKQEVMHESFQEYSDDQPRDDHGMWTAGGTVHGIGGTSVEELKRPGVNFKIGKTGELTYLGKQVDVNLKPGEALVGVDKYTGHYTVRDGSHDTAKKFIHKAFAALLLRPTKSQEAEDLRVGDKRGLTSKEAAEYAAQHAAEAVKGIDEQTVQQYADAVEQAIDEQLGVKGLSKLLRDISSEMSTTRADLIAQTEMADAFGEASLQKLQREEVEYKQLIPSPGACEICLGIIAMGPVPIDEPFVDDDGEEHDRSPIHPRCRCATVGARPPKE